MHLAKDILKGKKLTGLELKKAAKEELKEYRTSKTKALRKKC